MQSNLQTGLNKTAKKDIASYINKIATELYEAIDYALDEELEETTLSCQTRAIIEDIIIKLEQLLEDGYLGEENLRGKF